MTQLKVVARRTRQDRKGTLVRHSKGPLGLKIGLKTPSNEWRASALPEELRCPPRQWVQVRPGVPKDLRHIEKKSAWVKCLGSVSRFEAETLDGLAYEHGKRILALRGVAKGAPQTLPLTRSFEGQTGTLSVYVPDQTPNPAPDDPKPHRSLMWLVDLWERRRSPRSQIGLARTMLCVRRFIDLVGDLEPHEVTRAHVIA